MKDAPAAGPSGSAAVLPRPRSFVVQLAADASPHQGSVRGRAVHITSGEASSFESMAELLGFLGASIERAEQNDGTVRTAGPPGREP